MKKRNMSLIMVYSLIVLLILKLIFFDRNVLNIILSSAYLGFFLITIINVFRKKETSIQKNYLSFLLVLLVFVNFIQTGILLFSGKNIVNSLFYSVVLWMMLNSIRRILGKKEFAAKKVFIASIVLFFIPSIGSLNLELLSSVVIGLLIILFFNNSKENYFGLFDASYIDSGKEKFKITQWVKTFIIVLIGIIYLYLPVFGSILTLIMVLLCISGIFDNLILVYEQVSFNKKVRKNKIFVASKEVYGFAPGSDFLRKRIEAVAMKTILGDDIPYETYALMDINGARKFESINELTSEEEISDLFKNRVRPEVICKMLVTMYDGKKKKVVSKIEKVTAKFYEEYLKYIEEDKNIIDKVDCVNELYDKYCDEIRKIIG